MAIYWIASYPKSGNTWFRAVLKNYLENRDDPLSIDDLGLGGIASFRQWFDEVLGFDSAELTEEEVRGLRPAVYRWEGTREGVEYHKTHDAYGFLQGGEALFPAEGAAGAVYILRNPLDLAVSYAHYYLCGVDQAIEQMGCAVYLSRSRNRRLDTQVCQHLSTWSGHVLSWVDAGEMRVEAFRYEDMKNDPMTTFSRAVGFLGLPLDGDRLAKAVRFSDFQELRGQEEARGFRSRPIGVRRFFRKGIAGDWKNVLTEAQVRRLISDHGEVMERFGYLDSRGNPVET